VPKRGGDVFSGGAELFAQGTQPRETTCREREGPGHLRRAFPGLRDGNTTPAGPSSPVRVNYFLSASQTDFARYPQSLSDSVSSSLKTGLLNLTANLGAHELALLWTGYDVSRSNPGPAHGFR